MTEIIEPSPSGIEFQGENDGFAFVHHLKTPILAGKMIVSNDLASGADGFCLGSPQVRKNKTLGVFEVDTVNDVEKVSRHYITQKLERQPGAIAR